MWQTIAFKYTTVRVYCSSDTQHATSCQVIGDVVAPLKRQVAESVEWAKLESAGESTVTQFIHTLFQDHTQAKGVF